MQQAKEYLLQYVQKFPLILNFNILDKQFFSFCRRGHLQYVLG